MWIKSNKRDTREIYPHPSRAAKVLSTPKNQ